MGIQMDDEAIEVIGLGGIPTSSPPPLGTEHEVIDQQLTA